MFPDLTRDDVFRIETARLWLRWPRAVDARDFVRLAVDPQVVKQVTGQNAPLAARAADEFVRAARRANVEGGGIILALSPRHDPSALIGMAGLQTTGEGRMLALSYWLGRPYRGQGLMREAIEALVDMAFVLTDAQEIKTSLSRETPEAAARVLASCGFPPADGDGQARITRSGWLAARAQAVGRIALPQVAAA